MAGRMQPATSKCTISIAVEIRSMPENEVVLPGVDRCLCRGLSRMLLMAHVRFLEGGSSAAMRCCYLTRDHRHIKSRANVMVSYKRLRSAATEIVLQGPQADPCITRDATLRESGVALSCEDADRHLKNRW